MHIGETTTRLASFIPRSAKGWNILPLTSANGDVAAAVPWFVRHYDSSEPVNVSAGRRISIRELAETVKKTTGFAGENGAVKQVECVEVEWAYDQAEARVCPSKVEGSEFTVKVPADLADAQPKLKSGAESPA